MKKFFDYSKIRKFNIADLVGKELTIKSFLNENEGVELIQAFDMNSGDYFLLEVKFHVISKEQAND